MFALQDPLLMYPRNQGIVRDIQEKKPQTTQTLVKSSFHSHIQTFSECTTNIVREAKLIDL